MRIKPMSVIFPVCLFALLSAVYYPHFFSRIYVDLNDGWCQFYSRLLFFKCSISRHVFPLWNPSVLCGIPDGLDAYSNYTLGHLLVSMFTLKLAWNGTILLGAFFSGYFVFFILRKYFNLRNDASILGGFIYFTLSVNVPTEYVPFSLPVLLILATEWDRSRQFCWAFFLALFNAWHYLATNPHHFLYVSIFLYLYLLAIFFKRNPDQNVFVLLLRASIPFFMMAGMIAFHLLRVVNLFLVSHRQQAVKDIMNILLPTDLLGMVFPGYSYNSMEPAMNFIPTLMRRGIVMNLFETMKIRFLDPPYVGLVPLALTALLILKKKKRNIEIFFLLTVIFILLYLIFNPAFFFVRYIPILKDLPVINRIYSVFYFAMSLLAAFSFEGIKQYKERPQKIIRNITFLSTLVIGAMLARCVLWGILVRWNDVLCSFALEQILPVVLKQRFYAASEWFYRDRILQIMTFGQHWLSPFNAYYLYPATAMLVMFFVAIQFFKGRLALRSFFFTLLLLIFLDSKINLVPQTSYAEQSLTPFQLEAEFILKDRSLYRVMPLQQPIDRQHPSLIEDRQSSLRTIVMRPETNLLYPLQTPEGYRSLTMRRYVRFFELLSRKQFQGWLLGEVDDVDDYYADLANVRYVITHADRTVNNYSQIYEGGGCRIFENKDALARAYLVHKAEVINDEAEVFKMLRQKAFDIRKTVLLEDNHVDNGHYDLSNAPKLPGIKESVTVLKYDANHLDLSVNSAQEGFLVVSDAFDHGWHAYVDDQKVDISRANYVFKAVRVPRGVHQIKFTYAPPEMTAGLWVAGATLLFGALASILHFVKSRRK